MKRTLGALSAALTLALPMAAVSAQFVGHYSEWRERTRLSQLAYSQGLYDGQLLANQKDLVATTVSRGLTQCAAAIGLNAGMIADAITKYYESDPDTWGHPPMVAFSFQIVRGACLDYVNAERKTRGMELWESGSR